MSDTGSSSGTELGAAGAPPAADADDAVYGAAIRQFFRTDHVVREALSSQLSGLTTTSLQVRADATKAFTDFSPSRRTLAERKQPTYVTAGSDLTEVLDGVVDRGVRALQALPEPGRLRLHLTPAVQRLVDTTGATEDTLGTIRLTDLIDLTRTTVPLPPADPTAPCRAETRADALLDAIDDTTPEPAPVAQSQFVEFRPSVAGNYPADDTQHDYLVADMKEQNWPAVATWQVPIPAWAVECDAELQVFNAQIVVDDVYGKMWLDFSGTPTVPQTYAIEHVVEAARHVVAYGVTFPVPAELRGKVVTVRSKFQSYKERPGRLDAKGGTTTKLALNFQRSPDTPAPADVADHGTTESTGVIKAATVTTGDPGNADGRAVLDKVDELVESMRTPETAPAFDIPRRADQESLRTDIASFELRSGPADVTSYHDFSSLRIAFEGVWTEVFDGRLAELGRQLYQESVKLKTFAGVDPAGKPIDTLDDLKRLMTEVRDLAQITVDVAPSEVRPHVVARASEPTSAVDIAKKVLLGGPTGNKTVDTILNPAGAAIDALTTALAGKTQLTWDAFGGDPLPVGKDVITATFEADAVAAGIVEIVVENTPSTSWWKGIDFREFDTNGTVRSHFRISTDPNDGGVWDKTSYNRLPLYTPQLTNGLLEFQKAAFLGVHTGYYTLTNLPARIPDRTRVTFRWEKD